MCPIKFQKGKKNACAEKLSTLEPTRHRNSPEALATGVRPYERTPWPAWQPDRTNWCHGSPAGHAWSLLARGQPPSSPDGRGRPNRQSSPLMATFLMLSRSRGAIGRVQATPGALSTAGRTTDGPDGRTDGSPGGGKGLNIERGKRCLPRREMKNAAHALMARLPSPPLSTSVT